MEWNRPEDEATSYPGSEPEYAQAQVDYPTRMCAKSKCIDYIIFPMIEGRQSTKRWLCCDGDIDAMYSAYAICLG